MTYIDKNELLNNATLALEHLNLSRSQLIKARNYGIADILGGMLFISLAKHNCIKAAQDEAKTAQRYINRVISYFGDVKTISLAIAKVNDFFGVTDAFVDNVISDFIMQDRINDSIRDIDETINKVEQIILQLERM